MKVKGGLGYLIALPLFFNLSNSQTFQLDDSVKVMYEDRLYFIDQYKADNTKRRYAYEIYSTNENGERNNLIGDDNEEFEAYADIALYGNFIFDRYNMVNDLTKFKISLRQVDEFYKLNKAMHRATLESVKFGTEIALERDLTREKLAKKIEREYGEKPKGKLKEFSETFIDEFLNSKIKNKKGFERLVNSQFFDESSNKVLDVLDSLSTLQTKISLIDDISYNEFLDLRERLYGNLRTAIELRTMQASYIILINDFGSKSALIGDQILKTVFDKIQDGEQIYNQLKRIGLNIESLNEGIEKLIEKSVQTNIRVFNTEIGKKEQEFNPKNPNSRASKFLKKRIKNDFTINNLLVLESGTGCTGYEFLENSLVVFAEGCDLNNHYVNIIFPQNFHDFKDSKISFDIETITDGGVGCRVGVAGYINPREANSNRSNAFVFGGKSGERIHYDIRFKRTIKDSVFISKTWDEGYKTTLDEFDISNLDRWFVKILTEGTQHSRFEEDRHSKIRISNVKIN